MAQGPTSLILKVRLLSGLFYHKIFNKISTRLNWNYLYYQLTLGTIDVSVLEAVESELPKKSDNLEFRISTEHSEEALAFDESITRAYRKHYLRSWTHGARVIECRNQGEMVGLSVMLEFEQIFWIQRVFCKVLFCRFLTIN